MKLSSIVIAILAISCASFANAAGTDDGYMEGHPSYNQDYYNPSYNKSDSSPNYDSDYYNKQYNYNNNNSDDRNDAPHGNDIRDYNPAYDRYGNLK
jgi:hypothetical protein